MRTGIWRLLLEETDGAQHQLSQSALFSYRYDSFMAYRVQTLRAHWSIARRPVRCVPLTAIHCRLGLTWSREHALWTPQQWSWVMFSDESRFSFSLILAGL
ncbi:transposable element Tcb2 transposase [Trichonephila clavipes]|nr:transposable element Tcb2 transposase [Trichonephila clavipes]